MWSVLAGLSCRILLCSWTERWLQQESWDFWFDFFLRSCFRWECHIGAKVLKKLFLISMGALYTMIPQVSPFVSQEVPRFHSHSAPALQAPTARDALLEVEALLDHLFQHPNTPGFVAYRMIQRFVTSNPSSAYVQAVSDAFKTGRDGKGIDPFCTCDCWRVNHHRTTSIKPEILVWDSCWNRLLRRSHLQWRLRGSEGNYDGSAFAQRSTLPDQCKQRRVARAISQGDVELSNVLLRVHVSIIVYKLLADDPNSLRDT